MNDKTAAGMNALRPLRTRRPFTPREPQRTLFTERARRKDQRPPSAFDLKHLILSENGEDIFDSSRSTFTSLDEDDTKGESFNEILNTKKKSTVPQPHRQDRPNDGWSSFPKLPHLSGRSKPLHRRNTTGPTVDARNNIDLAQSILVSQPLIPTKESSAVSDNTPKLNNNAIKSLSPDSSSKKKLFTTAKSSSYDASNLGDVSVKHLAVQLPMPVNNDYNNMTLLELAEALSPKSQNVEHILNIMGCLQDIVLKTTPTKSLRELVLRALYAHVDSDDERVLVAIARAMLTDPMQREPSVKILGLLFPSNYQHVVYAHNAVLCLVNSGKMKIINFPEQELNPQPFLAVKRCAVVPRWPQMRVTGPHLAAACKLIFKIARNDKNDHFFHNSNLLDLLIEGSGRIDPVAESESCVYAAGALRFLALEPRLRARALTAGALHLAALHLKIFNNAKAERPRQMSDQATHALYQVTGALRNLAAKDEFVERDKGKLKRAQVEIAGVGNRTEQGEGEGQRDTFVSSGALAELLTALTLHTDRDVLTNVARCLSVLSGQEACCAWLCAAPAGAGSLLQALAACASRAALAVRLAYTLGNMAAADALARIHIYNEDGGVDVLLTILELYTQRNDTDSRDPDADPDLHLVGSDVGGSDGSNEDVLIKTVRVVANICLAELAGRGVAANYAERTVRALLSCLAVAEKPLDNKLHNLSEKERNNLLERREELATAVLATLNNITFYLEPSGDYPESHTLELLCKTTCKWIKGPSAAACEAIRALGNLSRWRCAALTIVLEGALDTLPTFQQHEDPSVRCAAAGVLVNVCGAGAGCTGGAGGAGGAGGVGGAEAAARALCVAARAHDAQSAALLVRALWNALSFGPLDSNLSRSAAAALAVFIDDDSIFDACEATKCGERRASDPQISKNNVKFETDNQKYYPETGKHFLVGGPKLLMKAYSVEEELHLEEHDENDGRYSGEDLGFEEGDSEACECAACARGGAAGRLLAVARPLLRRLRPPTRHAAVGTD